MRLSLRKIILIVVIILILLLAGWIIAKGFKIGNLQIKGIIGIAQKNEEIDQKNEALSNIASVTYNSKLSTLNQTGVTLQDKKEQYENEAMLVTASGGTGYLSTTEKYEIEFLWTRLGNYAGDEGVDIKIDVTNSSISGKYDLNFTVTGSYVGITDFIYDIENDSKLGFKIEDFSMNAVSVSTKDDDDDNTTKKESSTTTAVQATFSCKQININIQTIDTTKSAQGDEEDENAETLNTTNSNTTSNTTTTTTTTTTTNSTTTSANSVDDYLNQ